MDFTERKHKIIEYIKIYGSISNTEAQSITNDFQKLTTNKILPISFINTPKEDYIKAILYFYEKQNPHYFKQLVLNKLNNSLRDYIG